MHSFDLLRDTTDLLVRALRDGVTAAGVRAVSVTTGSPLRPVRDPSAPRLNLWLYKVSPDAASRTPDRAALLRHLAAPHLPLRLHYVLTAFGGDDPLRLRLLGVGLQALAARPRLTDPGAPDLDLRVALVDATLDEINAVWNTVTHARETSVLYEVTGAWLAPLGEGEILQASVDDLLPVGEADEA